MLCKMLCKVGVPHPTRLSLHRCFQRHGISRLPELERLMPRKAFKAYPLSFFHIDQSGRYGELCEAQRLTRFWGYSRHLPALSINPRRGLRFE